MIQTIDTSQEVNLDWSSQGSDRKVRNIRNLLNTWRYEVAYNRIMGLNPDIPDKPAGIAAALYAAEVYRLIQDYQPDVIIKSVTYNGIDSEGNVDALVVLEI